MMEKERAITKTVATMQFRTHDQKLNTKNAQPQALMIEKTRKEKMQGVQK